MLLEPRQNRQSEKKALLEKEIKKESLRAQGMTQKDLEMEEMKQEVVKLYKKEADDYVQAEIQKFQQLKLAELEE